MHKFRLNWHLYDSTYYTFIVMLIACLFLPQPLIQHRPLLSSLFSVFSGGFPMTRTFFRTQEMLKNICLMKDFYPPGNLWEICYYNPNLTDKETESQWLQWSCKLGWIKELSPAVCLAKEATPCSGTSALSKCNTRPWS